MAQLNPQASNAVLELIQSPRIQLAPFDPSEETFSQWLQLFDEVCISASVRDEPMENHRKTSPPSDSYIVLVLHSPRIIYTPTIELLCCSIAPLSHH